jgi:hypothetical protein
MMQQIKVETEPTQVNRRRHQRSMKSKIAKNKKNLNGETLTPTIVSNTKSVVNNKEAPNSK